MERRDFLGMASAAGAVLVAGPATAATREKSSGFLWGTAGAAYQVEGANIASDLWVMEHIAPPFQLADDVWMDGDARRSRDFFRDQQVQLAGRFGGQCLETLAADHLDFLRALQEGHAQTE